ncbi:MAG: LruC domain-containing protein [Mucinivorans sp.]
MNKTTLSISVLLFSAALTVSCAKQLSGDGPVAPATSFTDMVVPSNFDWRMTQNVTTNFTSDAHQTMVYLSMPDASEPFSSFFVGKGVAPMTLSIPTAVDKIKVQYQKEGSLSAAIELPVVAGSISYAVPADSKEVSEIHAAAPSSRGGDFRKPTNPETVIPAYGMGTLMFEDLYPAYGDYDFNDVVINYSVHLASLSNNKNQIDVLTATFRVASLGGTLPFEFYMQLDDVRASNVNKDYGCQVTNSKNARDKVTITKLSLDKSDGPVAFAIGGIKANKNTNSTLINSLRTQKTLFENQLVEVTVSIIFDKAVDIETLKDGKINFFIAKEVPSDNYQLYEIHCADYAPTSSGEAEYWKCRNKSNLTDKCTQSYTSNTNLVWAINIPTKIQHLYESKVVETADGKNKVEYDITDAYPQFKQWATSGGLDCKTWYYDKNRNQDMLVPMV